ncbi:Beta sliding clamp [wastewater metagenome]|uniref:Beta sliding clamp n=2 Tax=unclassified sequences TaxID=12908 RepID=A0A5B8REA7_9ZZZZ|nr:MULTISPECIES: DNA polymerase III subunit beta [Arhodomonas]MCS4504961.1 DNA polymerase III subunit beta [Arhodomonas aquaeolei]QEA05077.1 beta sliding clamp [uncultured organism]
MHFEIDRETFLKPLQSIIGVVERRQTLPILSNILIVADSDSLSLTSTDLEVELQAHLSLPVEEPGQITVPARKLLDIVRNLPDESRLTVRVEQDRAIIQSGRSQFRLMTLPAGDFPSVEDIGDVEEIELSQANLRWLIDKTHFAMALQDVRYYLNGLLLELEPDHLRAVATDGHRLALAEFNAQIALEQPRQVIVPRKGIQEILRLLEHSDEPVRVELGNNHIRARLPHLRFTSKLIDGRFPDYQRVIPEADGNCVHIDRESLRQGLVRASILSNEKYRGVRVVLSGDSVTIRSENPEQEQAEEELSAEYGGDDLEIGFNAGYMLDAVGAIEQPSIEMFVTDANASALIRGEGESQVRYVVMPMRL